MITSSGFHCVLKTKYCCYKEGLTKDSKSLGLKWHIINKIDYFVSVSKLRT